MNIINFITDLIVSKYYSRNTIFQKVSNQQIKLGIIFLRIFMNKKLQGYKLSLTHNNIQINKKIKN